MSEFLQAVGARLGKLDLADALLILMLGLMALLVFLAQRADGFDFRDMLLDDNGKPSMLRILAVGSWGVSSWVVIRDAQTVNGADVQVLVVYLGFWSGAPIAAKFIEALHAKWTIGAKVGP